MGSVATSVVWVSTVTGSFSGFLRLKNELRFPIDEAANRLNGWDLLVGGREGLLLNPGRAGDLNLEAVVVEERCCWIALL